MNNVNYYSKAFPFYVFPGDKKIYEFGQDDFQKVMDALFYLIDIQSNKEYLRKPSNLIVSETKDNIFIGVNFDKAILGYTSLVTIKGVLNSDEEAEKYLRILSINELGFNLNFIVKINRKVFKSAFNNLLLQFNANQKTNSYIYVFSDDIKECIKAFQKSIENSNYIYGGNGMWVNPIFKAKDITIDPKMCFYVLPFNDTRLRLLEKIIKPELEKQLGINVIKSGDIFQPNQNIMESIWTYINQASFIIADISDKNPNVFYELGICHTIGKKVITLCDQESYEKDYKEKLPFDISSLNTIFYRKDLDGPQELVNKLIDYIKLMRPEESHLND